MEKERLKDFIKSALAEDVGDGDHTSLATIPAGKRGEADLLIKQAGILAGVDEALAVFNEVDNTLDVAVYFKDGDRVVVGDVAFRVTGSVHSVLTAERLVLNIMQRMSGIATVTKHVVEAIAGTGAQVLDTRKTTPLLRFLEKKAVVLGGGTNHRFGLYDMILIKDNHVDYAGGIREAIEAAQRYRKQLGRSLAIEVEVRSLDELETVLEVGGVDRIMLDNFSPDLIRRAVTRTAGRYITEASGGINEYTVRDYAMTGVNYISIGALTHSVKSLDMSLKAKIISN